MKKLTYIFVSIFIILYSYNNSFAILTNEQQQKYKQEFLKSYEKFETKIDNYSFDNKKIILEKIINKINKLLNSNLSEKNNFILNILKDNIEKKLSLLNSLDDNKYIINNKKMDLSKLNITKYRNIENFKAFSGNYLNDILIYSYKKDSLGKDIFTEESIQKDYKNEFKDFNGDGNLIMEYFRKGDFDYLIDLFKKDNKSIPFNVEFKNYFYNDFQKYLNGILAISMWTTGDGYAYSVHYITYQDDKIYEISYIFFNCEVGDDDYIFLENENKHTNKNYYDIFKDYYNQNKLNNKLDLFKKEIKDLYE